MNFGAKIKPMVKVEAMAASSKNAWMKWSMGFDQMNFRKSTQFW